MKGAQLMKRPGVDRIWDEAVAMLVATFPGLRARELVERASKTNPSWTDVDIRVHRALSRLEECGAIIGRRDGKVGRAYYAAEGTQEALPWPTGRET